MRTLVDLVVERAERHPDRGYRFLADGVTETAALSYLELDRRCRALASVMQEAGFRPGARALLLYSPGLDFIEAFWACAYAGVIAVPAPTPDPLRFERTAPRLRAIAADCRPSLVLIDGAAIGQADVRRMAPELRDAALIETPRVPSAPYFWLRPRVDDAAPAVIQYTSGSTGAPRGVVISHANFLHNLEMLKRFHGDQEHAVMVHWLPLFHDMGLIRGMMSPLHMGGDCIMMPPLQFVQRPHRWLAAISRYRATVTGAPNFGYGLCTRKIVDGELDSLDLSSLRVAFCSSEPIRAPTVRAFVRKFAACGFSAECFRPSYGLAEATVMVCGEHDHGPRFRAVDRAALRSDRFVEADADGRDAVEIACCGRPIEGQEVVTVVGEGRIAGPHEIGEIWVRGPSIASGYWEKAAATEETFGRRLASGDGPFMRSGDLGWLSESGELFVTGRKKDLIVIRGENYYPQDIESVIETSVPQLRQGCSAAFAVDGVSGEHVVVVGELTGDDAVTLESSPILAAIRGAVSEVFGLALGSVALISPGTIPKTASGKVQRGRARDAFLKRELSLLHGWTARGFMTTG